MQGKDAILINDDLFQQTITCPLKFVHITENQEQRRPSGLVFRQRNKLHVRDAIAHQFQNCKYTSNPVQQAKKETEEWLNLESVAICGAVICHENLLTRIPILLKEGKSLTIIQVHGKLRKRSEGVEIRATHNNRSTNRYLLKAAYRREIVSLNYPDSEINVDFYFPNKYFKSSSDCLYLFLKEKFRDDEHIKQEFTQLFSKVKATEAVLKIQKNIPESVSHKSFQGLSVEDSIEKMLRDNSGQPNIKRHSGCKYCAFRLPEMESMADCWDKFFPSGNIHHPQKHIFELIGHGNNTESNNGTFYQEEAEFSKGFSSFEDMNEYGGPTITILQRRNLQILQASDKPVPSLWIKPGIKSIELLEYPLHFIDFEAATYAVPMKKGSPPYDPVYFQFSCHTLNEQGELTHTEWLDRQDGEIHPHEEFVNQLGKIPNIFKGTIMQYSPFEKQGVNRLIGDFERDPTRFAAQIHILEKIRKSEFPGYENRFFDMSKMIRDFYFNKFFSDGLGLKQVLSCILQWEQVFGGMELPEIKIGEAGFDVTKSTEGNETPDPYNDIQNPDFLITDGSAAMNAWLSFKMGLLTEEERIEMPKILKKYCALDSFALFIIYHHLRKFTREVEEKDLIKF